MSEFQRRDEVREMKKIPASKGVGFGKLVTTGQSEMRGRIRFIEMKCEHGNERFVRLKDLKKGKSTSCRQWPECAMPKIGERFGKLVFTGKSKRHKGRLFVEMKCDKHGNKRLVILSYLKAENTTSCLKWPECLPKAEERFGEFIATGRSRRQKVGQHYWRFIEMKCGHGNKKFVYLSSLRSGHVTSCRSWPGCGLTKTQSNHHRYLRNHEPRVSLPLLQKYQRGICIICGGTRKGVLNTHEHLIPVVRAARWRMSLHRKHEIVNHRFNIFAAHRFCNESRHDSSLEEYWSRNPKFRPGGWQAFSNLMAHHCPMGNKDMKIIVLILKEAGIYLDSEG